MGSVEYHPLATVEELAVARRSVAMVAWVVYLAEMAAVLEFHHLTVVRLSQKDARPRLLARLSSHLQVLNPSWSSEPPTVVPRAVPPRVQHQHQHD